MSSSYTFRKTVLCMALGAGLASLAMPAFAGNNAQLVFSAYF